MERKYAATMLIAPLDVMAQARGLNVLADVPGTLGRYQGLVGAVRGKWARENEQALIGFIRSYLAGAGVAVRPCQPRRGHRHLPQQHRGRRGVCRERVSPAGGSRQGFWIRRGA